MTPTPRRRPALLTSLLFAAAALLAIAYAGQVASRIRSGNAPQLVVLSPRPGDALNDSLVVRFRTDAPLELTPHGWAAGDLHPHALIDDTEYMAAAADIRSVGAGEYSWRLPASTAGEHTLRLGWAGPDHRPRKMHRPVRFRFE